jgi:hypothetical protein
MIEFGSGSGRPIIKILKESGFKGFIEGYELCGKASQIAQQLIKRDKLAKRYTVKNTCFFKSNPNQARAHKSFLIANPPYLPASDGKLNLPNLYGGEDGSTITRRLLSQNFDNVMVLLSSYSNPKAIIRFAEGQKYVITDYFITLLPFGNYTLQPKVLKTIDRLKKRKKAFVFKNTYLLAGAFFQKVTRKNLRQNQLENRSEDLIRLLSSMGKSVAPQLEKKTDLSDWSLNNITKILLTIKDIAESQYRFRSFSLQDFLHLFFERAGRLPPDHIQCYFSYEKMVVITHGWIESVVDISTLFNRSTELSDDELKAAAGGGNNIKNHPHNEGFSKKG